MSAYNDFGSVPIALLNLEGTIIMVIWWNPFDEIPLMKSRGQNMRLREVSGLFYLLSKLSENEGILHFPIDSLANLVIII